MTIYSLPNLGVSWGQSGGQKGRNVPFSKKNECYELELRIYTLNHVGKLTNTQLIQTNTNFQVSVV